MRLAGTVRDRVAAAPTAFVAAVAASVPTAAHRPASSAAYYPAAPPPIVPPAPPPTVPPAPPPTVPPAPPPHPPLLPRHSTTHPQPVATKRTRSASTLRAYQRDARLIRDADSQLEAAHYQGGGGV